MRTKIKLITEDICKKRDISQTVFIRLMDGRGVSRNTAIKVYHGDASVLLDVAASAAEVLDVQLSDLVQWN